MHGRFASVPRVPNFKANNRLKFTAEEQQAILAAERGFGCQPQSNIVARSNPQPGLALAIALALAYFLFLTLVGAVVHSFVPPESRRQGEAPTAELIQRGARSQTIPNGAIVVFPNQEVLTNRRKQ
jgi:hypothetical protein